MSTPIPEHVLNTAHAMADAARSVILPLFRTSTLSAENKLANGFDPVTEADRAAEQAMRKVLSAARPEDGVLGEEFGETQGHSGYRWVLDPIDGTRGFISGTPTWGILISLEKIGHGPVFGMIDQPYIGERFWGGLGFCEMVGPFGEGQLGVRPTKFLSDATLFTTFPEVGSASEARAFHAVARHARLTRYGMDCYAYALLALGQIDLVIEAGLNAYDIQAPIAVIEAAGGIVTDWRGQKAHLGGRVLAAATPQLHAEVLAILSKEIHE